MTLPAVQRLFVYRDGHRSERALGVLLAILDRLWLPLRALLWVCVVVGLFVLLLLGLAASLEISIPDLRTAPVIGHFFAAVAAHSGWLIAALVGFLALSLAAWWAHGARADIRAADDPQPQYDLQKARWLEPAEYVPAYVPQIYLRRRGHPGQPDDQARTALRAAIRARKDGPLGICVVGRHGQGKTRLAWEALQAEMPGWTLVRWSHTTTHAFDLDEIRSRRVILWVDDLHEYANLAEAPTLCDLPRVFRKAHMRLVVVATCHEGTDEAHARLHLTAILNRLRDVRLSDIADDEADNLLFELARKGVTVHRSAFDGTPGSLVLDLAHRRAGIYDTLPEGARRVLRALKLLRSAGIVTCTQARLRAAAEALFALPADPSAWPLARGALVSAGLIRLTSARIARARLIEPVAPAFLDEVVADYPEAGTPIASEWPRLREHLAARSDAAGLFALGNRYRELGGNDIMANLQHAEVCYWEALRVSSQRSAPVTWAGASSNLGITLTAESDLVEGSQRIQLLAVASKAQRAALRVYRRRGIWENWVRTQTNLALTLREAAGLADVPDRARLLHDAVRALRAAAGMQINAVSDTALLRAQTTLETVAREERAVAEQTDRLQRLRDALRSGRAAISAGRDTLARQAAHLANASRALPTLPIPFGRGSAHDDEYPGVSIAADEGAGDGGAPGATTQPPRRSRHMTLPPLIGVFRDPGQTAPIPVPNLDTRRGTPGAAGGVVIGEEVRTQLEEQDRPPEDEDPG